MISAPALKDTCFAELGNVNYADFFVTSQCKAHLHVSGQAFKQDSQEDADQYLWSLFPSYSDFFLFLPQVYVFRADRRSGTLIKIFQASGKKVRFSVFVSYMLVGLRGVIIWESVLNFLESWLKGPTFTCWCHCMLEPRPSQHCVELEDFGLHTCRDVQQGESVHGQVTAQSCKQLCIVWILLKTTLCSVSLCLSASAPPSFPP